jgi:hypothetical protein
MDHGSDREVAGAVRALLVEATGDGPPETDLLDKVRHRVRRQRVRRRVLVPSLATLTTASVIAAAALVASVVTGTPSAQARVAAAAGRTAAEGYRVRIVSTKDHKLLASSITQTAEGIFDPAQRTGRLLIQIQGQRLEARFVGDLVYMERAAAARSNGKRWVAQRRIDRDVAMPVFVLLTKRAWQDPQQALARLRSAAAVHEQGRVAGDGWRGRRYFFELMDDKDVKRGARTTGTVDVDQAGRVRRLEVATQSATDASRIAGTFRTVMEFRDYGAREAVSAPPAGEVARAPLERPGLRGPRRQCCASAQERPVAMETSSGTRRR